MQTLVVTVPTIVFCWKQPPNCVYIKFLENVLHVPKFFLFLYNVQDITEASVTALSFQGICS